MVIAATLTLAGVLLGRKQVINQSRNVRLDEYYRECRVVASSIVTASREVYVETPRIASVPEPATSTPDKSGFVKRMEKFADQTGALSHALDSFHILVDDTQIREDATLLQQENRKLAKSVANFLDKAEKDASLTILKATLQPCEVQAQRLLFLSYQMSKNVQDRLAPTIVQEQRRRHDRIHRRVWRWLVCQHEKNLSLSREFSSGR